MTALRSILKTFCPFGDISLTDQFSRRVLDRIHSELLRANDAEALRSDWEAIGRDIRNAMKQQPMPNAARETIDREFWNLE